MPSPRHPYEDCMNNECMTNPHDVRIDCKARDENKFNNNYSTLLSIKSLPYHDPLPHMCIKFIHWTLSSVQFL